MAVWLPPTAHRAAPAALPGPHSHSHSLQFYKESKGRFDEEPDFKVRSYEEVVKLQSGDADVTKAWQLICDVSRAAFEGIYKRLDVTV